MSNPKVQLSVICGSERDLWIEPSLHEGLLIAVSRRLQNGWKITSQAGYGFRTSQEARNAVTRTFLEGDCEWLLMIDNDTGLIGSNGYIDPMILIDATLSSGARIMAAPIPVIKGDKWHLNCYRRVEHTAVSDLGGIYAPVGLQDLRQWEADPGKPVTDDRLVAGTGMIAIHRRVFQKLAESPMSAVNADTKIDHLCRGALTNCKYLNEWADGFYEQLPRQRDIPHWLRPRRPGGQTIIGEDFFFCERARHAGFPTYVLPAAYCSHHHTWNFHDAPLLMFALAEQPTAADYGLDSLHGLEPSPMTIQPWQANQLRQLLLEAPQGNTAIEFGGGISSVVLLSQLRQSYNAAAKLITVETDQKWLAVLKRIRKHFSPVWSIWSIVLSYDPLLMPISGVNFIFIDGPTVTEDYPDARFYTLPQIPESALVPGALIVLDDYNRDSEKTAVCHWQSVLQGSLHLRRVIGPPNRQMAVFAYQPR